MVLLEPGNLVGKSKATGDRRRVGLPSQAEAPGKGGIDALPMCGAADFEGWAVGRDSSLSATILPTS